MKKKILAIISILIAFVMCFALVACDRTGSPENPQEPSDPADKNKLPADKTVTAVENLATLHGYTVGGKITLESGKSTQPEVIEFTLEKKGDTVKITSEGMDTVYFNVDTGYVYVEKSGVLTFEQVVPDGYAAYVVDVIKKAMPVTDEDKAEFYEKMQNSISYDGDTKTGSYTVQLKDIVNELVAPLQKSYKNGGTICALIDEYLEMFVADENYQSVAGVLTQLIAQYDNVKDVTFGTLIDTAEQQLDGVTVPELLERIGLPIPDDQWPAIKARTVGEAAAGLIKYVDNILAQNKPQTEAAAAAPAESVTEGGNTEGGTESGGMADVIKQYAMEAVNAMLFEEVTEDELKAVPQKLETYKSMILGGLNMISVKTAVDALDGKVPSDVMLYITKGIKFTALDATVEFTFDDGYNFSNIKLNGVLSHNYAAQTGDGAEFFADNDYKCTVDLAISDYVTEGEYNLTVAARPLKPETVDHTVIVKADPSAQSVDFYYEEAGTITVSGYKFFNAAGAEYNVAANAVTYDAASKTFSVKYPALAPIIAAENFYTDEAGVITMRADVTYATDSTYTLEVKFVVAKDETTDSLVDVTTPIIMSLISKIPSDAPNA